MLLHSFFNKPLQSTNIQYRLFFGTTTQDVAKLQSKQGWAMNYFQNRMPPPQLPKTSKMKNGV